MTTLDGGVGVHPGLGRMAAAIELEPEDIRIPVHRYTSPEFAQREVERLWSRTWQIVCRADTVPNPGDYFEYTVGPLSFLVVRGQDHVLRAFRNVCPHRANLLREGSGNTGDTLSCPFHFWSFNLDGSLKRIQDRETFCHIDESTLGLRPAACDTWGGWVFLNPNPDAEPLAEFLHPVNEHFAPYRFEHLVPVSLDLTTPVSANWKVCVEAFLELYHIHAIHPQVLPAADDVNVWFDTFGHHNRFIATFGVASPRLGPDAEPMDTFRALYGEMADKAASPDGQVRDRRDGDTGALGDIFVSLSAGENPMSGLERYRAEDGTLNLPEGPELRAALIEINRKIVDSKDVDLSGLTDDQLIDDWHYLIFPNVVLNVTATAVLFLRFRPDADDPNKCWWDITTCEWIADPERAKEVRANHFTMAEREQSLGVNLDQDAVQMPRIQRGLRSGALDHITLSKQEIRLVHFNQVLDRFLAG